MKKSAIIRIVIYSLLILLLAGLLGSALSFHRHGGWGRLFSMLDDDDYEIEFDDFYDDDDDEDDDDDDDDRKVEKVTASSGELVSVPAEAIHKIQIDWVSGDLQVQPGDVDSIEIRETESEHPMTYFVKEDKLTIQFSKKIREFSFGKTNMPSKDLTVTVPRDWAGKELEIHSVSADVDILGLTLKEVEYQGVSGKCRVLDSSLGELSVQTVSGDVIVEGRIRELECESVSADCDLTVTNVPEEISMEGVSGNLRLTLPRDAGFTVELEGLNKDLDTDFEVTSRNGKFIAGDGSCEIEIEGVSGRAKIIKAAEPAV